MKRALPAGWTAAVRILAFKGLRIVFRRRTANLLDSEASSLQQLQAAGSPLLHVLETGEASPNHTCRNLSCRRDPGRGRV